MARRLWCHLATMRMASIVAMAMLSAYVARSNATCATRGRRGARNTSQPTPMPPAAISRNASADSAGTDTPTSFSTYQIEPRSAPRSALRVQNSDQPSQAATMTGTLTASQATAAAPHNWPAAR